MEHHHVYIMGKSTISMAMASIANCNILPEGIIINPITNPIAMLVFHTSSTAQGGGGRFKNRKPIGEIDCCESRMAERIH